MEVVVVGNSLVRSLGEEKWELECFPGATLDRMMVVVETKLKRGFAVVLMVGVPDLDGGKGANWLVKTLSGMMEKYKGLVPCTFWPPEHAAPSLIREVVRVNEVIREGNAKRGWGTPHLEQGILVYSRTTSRYEVCPGRLEDGLHPSEREKVLMRERLDGWFRSAQKRGLVKERASERPGMADEKQRERETAWRGKREEAGEYKEREEVRREMEMVRRRREELGSQVTERVKEVEIEIAETEERKRRLEERRKELLEDWTVRYGEMGEELGRLEARLERGQTTRRESRGRTREVRGTADKEREVGSRSRSKIRRSAKERLGDRGASEPRMASSDVRTDVPRVRMRI